MGKYDGYILNTAYFFRDKNKEVSLELGLSEMLDEKGQQVQLNLKLTEEQHLKLYGIIVEIYHSNKELL